MVIARRLETSIATCPAAPAGVTAVTTLDASAWRLVQWTPPISTALVVERPLPMMVMSVPPGMPPQLLVTESMDREQAPHSESRMPRSSPSTRPSPLLSELQVLPCAAPRTKR